MKILYIIDSFIKMGGAEKNLIQLALGLKGRGEHVQMVFCLKGGPLVHALSKQGIEVLDLQLERVYGVAALKAVMKIVSYVKKNEIDLIMTYHLGSDFLGIILSILCGIPIISSRRDMGFSLRKRHIVFYMFANRFFDAITAVSNAVKESICEKQKADPKKISVVYNGIDSSIFLIEADRSHLKKEMGLDPNSAIVGCFAHLWPIKGHKYLIEAAVIVLKKIPETQFLLVGGYDSGEAKKTYKKLVELTEKKNVIDKIIVAGSRDDIPLILSLVDISVIPSLSEGFSNSILEAMAAAKPVVATDVGGNPEAVIDGKTGHLVPPADPKAMADALLKLLLYPELRCEMGLKGRQRVETEFSLNGMVNRYEDLLKYVHFRNKTPINKCIINRQEKLTG